MNGAAVILGISLLQRLQGDVPGHFYGKFFVWCFGCNSASSVKVQPAAESHRADSDISGTMTDRKHSEEIHPEGNEDERQQENYRSTNVAPGRNEDNFRRYHYRYQLKTKSPTTNVLVRHFFDRQSHQRLMCSCVIFFDRHAHDAGVLDPVQVRGREPTGGQLERAHPDHTGHGFGKGGKGVETDNIVAAAVAVCSCSSCVLILTFSAGWCSGL